MEAEKRLWWHVRHRLPLDGTYFQRQVSIAPHFADVRCLALKFIVELDGDQHGQTATIACDEARTAFLLSQGFTVLRFWTHRVFREIDAVLDTIAAAISPRTSGSSPG